jgi:fatty-acid desaturase
LTHQSFRARRWVECLGALFGTLTWRGPFAGPVRYIAMHRVHHHYADTDHDPHSPMHGIFRALLGWYWKMPYGFTERRIYESYAGAIARDPWHRFLDRNVDLLQLGWALFCFFAGAVAPMLISSQPFDAWNGLRFVVFGVFTKTLTIIYLGNAVDVINHGHGYRNYETNDRSTNSALMAVVHLGGAISWHNNHHAQPSYFRVKRQWWEFDMHYLMLSFLERLRWVSEVSVLVEESSSLPSSKTQPLPLGSPAKPVPEAIR